MSFKFMNRLGNILFLMLLCIVAVPAQAALTLAEVVEQIQQKYNATNTLKVHFTQTAYNKTLNQEQQAEGIVYIKNPGMMRWDYMSPEEQSFIVNDKNFWWYTPSNKQVIKKEAKSAFDSHLPLAFLSGMGKMSEDFNIKFAQGQQAKGIYALDLVPIKPQVNLKTMILKVDDERFDIQEVIMYDFYKNITTLKFERHQINSPIDNEYFDFEVPPGVQVVE